MTIENSVRSLVAKIFENKLEAIVKDIGANSSTLHMLGESAELMYRQDRFDEGEYIRAANALLVPHLLQSYEANSIPQELLSSQKYAELLKFLGTYHILRDVIYYSYDNSDAVSWEMENKNIKVTLNDDSILRQHASERITFYLNSKYTPRDLEQDDPEVLLKATRPFDFSDPRVERAFSAIESVVEWKIQYYFSYVPEDSNVMLDGYKYSTFIGIYKYLLTLAMYERYYSKANNISGVITYRENELLEQAAQQYPDESRASLAKIFKDIASSSRGTFNFITPENKYMLNPTCFSLVDGIANILRLFAKTDPNSFSSNISEIIGKGLVAEVKKKFEQYGNYKVYSDVKLNKFDLKLPDIDLLAISYEPSLGFHVFVGEVKNNLPAVWAKDYLKAKGEKGFITKAISQIETIKNFLLTADGAEFIHRLAIKAFPKLDINHLFPHGIFIVVDSMIISSQSIGMFFPESTTPIIDGATLSHIIDESDGDTNYVLFHLKRHNEFIDECIKRKAEKIYLGEYTIEYDAISIEKVYDLAKNEFASIGAIEKLEKQSLTEGYTMAGAFRHLGNEAYFMDTEEIPNNMSLFVIR